MITPEILEIRCARLEAFARDRIATVLYSQGESNRFPALQVGGDADGLHETTIKDARWFFYLTAKTPLGNSIRIEVEIAHDDAWIPYIAVSSTEAEDVHHTVMGADPESAVIRVKAVLSDLLDRAAARVKYEEENLPALLAGREDGRAIWFVPPPRPR